MPKILILFIMTNLLTLLYLSVKVRQNRFNLTRTVTPDHGNDGGKRYFTGIIRAAGEAGQGPQLKIQYMRISHSHVKLTFIIMKTCFNEE